MKINTSPHVDVYKRILNEQLDEAEAEPIHVLTLSQQPSFVFINPAKKAKRKADILYKSTEFSSVFLFAYLLKIMKEKNKEAVK